MSQDSIKIIENKGVGTAKAGTEITILETMQVKAVRIDEAQGPNGNTIYKFRAMCAEFGRDNLNENERFYTEEDYLPHLEYLEEEIRENSLLGELDHAEEYLPSMKAISHIITKIEYVESEGIVYIEFELLDTPDGKKAMAYADRGIPLYVSSRASGFIGDDGKVDLERIYTYDIVYRPGFRKAKSVRLNESLGVKSQRVTILEKEIAPAINNKNEQSKNKNMPTPEERIQELERNFGIFVNQTKSDIQKINKVVNVRESKVVIPESIKINDEEMESINQVPALGDSMSVEGTSYTVKDIKDIDDYGDDEEGAKMKGTYKYELYLEDGDGNVDMAYISDTGELHIIKADSDESPIVSGDIVESLADTQNKFNELVDEHNELKLNHQGLIKYVSLFKTVFEHFVGENDNQVEFSNSLADKLDEVIPVMNESIRNQDSQIKFINKLVGKIDEHILVTNTIIEASDNRDVMIKKINENTEELRSIVESAKIVNNGDSKNIEKTIAASGKILGSVKELVKSVKDNKTEENQAVLESKFNFYKDFSKEEASIFKSLSDTEQEMVSEKIGDGGTIKESLIAVSSKDDFKFLRRMPKATKKVWESFSHSKKQDVIGLFKMRNIQSDVEIDQFWENINLKIDEDKGLNRIDESMKAPGENSETTQKASDLSASGYTEDEMTKAIGL